MKSCRTAGAVLVICLYYSSVGAQPAPASRPAPAATAPDATLFRLFLKDGTSLVSYGEVARVGDRVVFSMPTTVGAEPELHLVNLPADRVDWDHTAKYAESARATRYLATRAELDYTQVSNEVAQALNAVNSTPDPLQRLAIVEKARKTLAEWPASHFNYKADEVKQMLGMLDEAIADLRAAAGMNRFDLALVAGPADALTASEPLLPAPSAKEAIEGVLNAAQLTDSPSERSSLLSAALSGIQKSGDALPADWAAATVASTNAAIAREQETDRAYRSLTASMLTAAKARANEADVRGLQRLVDQIHARDEAMGGRRPDAVKSLIDSVEVELDAARRLQLARDHWAMRASDLRKYRGEILASLDRFTQLKTPLENIKALAGSSPFALANIERTDAAIRKNIAQTTPPDELQQAHSLLSSAVVLADAAARIRREAALTASMTRAWDASAAAAGALMLVARARDELNAALQMPQLAALSHLPR
jgi:hypothetical protein